MKEYYLSQVIAYVPSTTVERVTDKQALNRSSTFYWNMVHARYNLFTEIFSVKETTGSKTQYIDLLTKRWASSYNGFMHTLYKEIGK